MWVEDMSMSIHRGSGHMTCSYHVARVPSSVISNFWFWEKGFHWYVNRHLCTVDYLKKPTGTSSYFAHILVHFQALSLAV